MNRDFYSPEDQNRSPSTRPAASEDESLRLDDDSKLRSVDESRSFGDSDDQTLSRDRSGGQGSL
jgi:hypothetical protein